MIGNPLKIKDLISERASKIRRKSFPKKHLNAAGVDRYVRDEVANIAFLGQKANRRILSRKPSDLGLADRVQIDVQP